MTSNKYIEKLQDITSELATLTPQGAAQCMYQTLTGHVHSQVMSDGLLCHLVLKPRHLAVITPERLSRGSQTCTRCLQTWLSQSAR